MAVRRKNKNFVLWAADVLGEETFPEAPYDVFPGNVGDGKSLVRDYDLFTENQMGI